MRIINTLFKHPVYDGLHAVFGEVARELAMKYLVCDDIDENYSRGLAVGSKKYLTRFRCVIDGNDIAPEPNDVLIVRSMFVSAQAFSSTLRGRKTFICEESWEAGTLKKGIFASIGQLLKKQPFVAHVPRVERFLLSRGFRTYYFPCFLEKRFSYKEGNHILYVARLVDIKHPQVIIELAKKMPAERFVIVATKPPGNADLYRKIMQEATMLPNITVYEKIPYPQLLELYQKAKVLLLPSESDPIGYCVLEALSCGTPAVSTSFTGSSDYLPNEWVVDSFDPVQWEERVCGILKDQSSARTKARKAFVDGKLELHGQYFKELVEKIKKEISKD